MQQKDYPEMILVRIGEIALKGLNRHRFVQQLIRNMKYRLKPLGRFEIRERSSRIWVTPLSEAVDMEAVLSCLSHVFGIVSISRVIALPKEIEVIKEAATEYVGALLDHRRKKLTFKVESRRIDKQFPVRSQQLNADLGAFLLAQYGERLRVDVHEPDFILSVEIRDRIYLYHNAVRGPAGLPSGMSGRGMLLLSGGIDSPVAGYMMASRGMTLHAVYFHTFPYTGPQALKKVEDLARLLSRFSGTIRFHLVDFTETQLTLANSCPEDMITIVMRRMMMRIADKLADREGAKCLITGESLGQVASQTLEALATTDKVCEKPVFRPLIGVDKNDTIKRAREIGTYETSILPYEDCCTVFVAKHPKTHPSLNEAQEAERQLDIDALVEMTMAKITSYPIQFYKR